MSKDVDLLADQIRRSFRGESWHGPAVLEVLEGVSAEDAAAHPIAGAHSIWEIVLHMAAGYRLVLRRMRGEEAQLAEGEEWPPVPAPTPEAWRELVQTLEKLNQELLGAVRALPSDRLLQPMGSEYTAFTQLAGAPQHDLYHAGQVVMLKKALAASRGKVRL
jgi:uncharacterized damage-inducible protein DinB